MFHVSVTQLGLICRVGGRDRVRGANKRGCGRSHTHRYFSTQSKSLVDRNSLS